MIVLIVGIDRKKPAGPLAAGAMRDGRAMTFRLVALKDALGRSVTYKRTSAQKTVKMLIFGAHCALSCAPE
jgi:hypothetical protein